MKTMKTMKKILAVLLALAMMILAAGCAKTAEVKDDASTAEAENEDAKNAAAYNKILEGLKYDDAGLPELTVAMSPDFAPMEFIDISRNGDEQYVGFDAILAKYIAKELNMKLVIQPMSFDAVQAAVQSNSADLGISGFSWTETRAANYFITDWYEAGENENEQVLITLKENEGKFEDAASFAGKKIGAQGASLQKILCEEQLPDAELELYNDLNVACTALLTGQIDALAVAKGNGDSFISKNEDKLVFTGFSFEVDDLYKNNVILVNKGNAELGEKVNTVLAKAKAAGLYQGWYEASQMLAKIKTVDELGYDDDGNKITE